MDRNKYKSDLSLAEAVALRKESVDRNGNGVQLRPTYLVSLSARRAWIEIIRYSYMFQSATLSLSARRAWIEISPTGEYLVAIGRSPQGERG